ncbi:MAG: protein arginine kinase [Caldibacillus debilis]|uniref:Protein-arginine kinase n=1 Tax=Caldibacillus debilis TaxID=301148 RepID=A0A3E0K8L3_9BACI|nr:protein arginine kinase [Caldibacillus debilis]MBY6270680.1 protein arginine kinase [Bacillaceae bacterium]OUM91196.1 MAG: protein arginine kinase [Caldibacillus debilis]REJ19254.1 MAG: protein arginine kinase [Caldibacillus debilis]REJ31465.1 MAG: protein arginine kinase [Caldibacillus debilis]
MSLERFLNQSASYWMNGNGPQSDIVLTSRIRLARNLKDFLFPTKFSQDEAMQVVQTIENVAPLILSDNQKQLEIIKMDDLDPLERRVLVEKHLISPHLAEDSSCGACLLSEDEKISIMINEEDHIRIQCIYPGLQLKEALYLANYLDDQLEEHLDFAFSETRGYLTSCPTNVGTGLRASVMIHLPGLVLTNQINKLIPTINQLGMVVRGIYGEGSEALGNIFQISNQITLGKSEEDIVVDLTGAVEQIIEQERAAREAIAKTSGIQLEDKVYRSLGVLMNSRIIESKEAAQCLSDVRLGIDMGYIKNIPRTVLNELMILTQPAFLQHHAGGPLRPFERDVRRAALIRERLNFATHLN